MTEAVRTSETSVYYETTRLYIPEDSNLHINKHTVYIYFNSCRYIIMVVIIIIIIIINGFIKYFNKIRLSSLI
jgi:hypothetical protein